MPSIESIVITKAITKFITYDQRPCNIIEGEGFKLLMKLLAPNYSIPDRKTFRLNYIVDLYN